MLYLGVGGGGVVCKRRTERFLDIPDCFLAQVSTVMEEHGWTIPPNASASFQGEDGERFRRLVLVVAATLQTRWRPPGRGCFFTRISSQNALRRAVLREEHPMVVWLPEADMPPSQTKNTAASYDLDKEFLYWVMAPKHNFLAHVPTHQPIYECVGGEAVQPVRVTEGIDNNSLVYTCPMRTRSALAVSSSQIAC